MRPPRFWQDGRGAWPLLLQPLTPVARLWGAARFVARRPQRVGVPVVCIGNLVAGGAGKTPVVLALLPLLRERYGCDAHVLARGYGGRTAGPLRIDPDLHDAAAMGDEPLLLARSAPTWMARDRRAGARTAVAAGARLLLLDDGFQDPSLGKDLSLVVVDGGYGFGNGRLMPAGPLREPVARGLGRADAAVLVGADRIGIADRLAARLPVLRATAVPGPDILSLPTARVFAFAGIGRPSKFFDMLTESGLDVAGSRSFPDHHRYRPDEVMRLCDAAAALRAIPVTTEKDHVRLPPEARAMVRPISMSLHWADAEAVRALLYSRLP
ncbi:tetraacyldisaccharide 4'-kinase [Constrictibacter sp. MBR-5]|jgi:tetraacyldisaccharide 4'-kinase|uniref:tetraacyldisaccharide 4'-kinase n=1 Tax=Constrictibacter sp. MBR-5 TaxID=3156467 RepID=UPI003395EAFC